MLGQHRRRSTLLGKHLQDERLQALLPGNISQEPNAALEKVWVRDPTTS